MAQVKKAAQTGAGTTDIAVPNTSSVYTIQTNVDGTATYSVYYSLNNEDFVQVSNMASATATAIAVLGGSMATLRLTVESGSGTVTLTAAAASYDIS